MQGKRVKTIEPGHVMDEAMVMMQVVKRRHDASDEQASLVTALCWLPEWQAARGEKVTRERFAAAVRNTWLVMGEMERPAVNSRETARYRVDKPFWAGTNTFAGLDGREVLMLVRNSLHLAPDYKTLNELYESVAKGTRWKASTVGTCVRNCTTREEWLYLRSRCCANVSVHESDLYERVLWPLLQEHLPAHKSLNMVVVEIARLTGLPERYVHSRFVASATKEHLRVAMAAYPAYRPTARRLQQMLQRMQAEALQPT